MQQARVESTSRMKFMRNQSVKVIDHPSFDVYNTLAGSTQIDFLDGLARGTGGNFWGGPAECAGPLEGFRRASVSHLSAFASPVRHTLLPRDESERGGG